MRLVAEVPNVAEDGVRWLVLRSDEESGGWFLFAHRSLRERCVADSWFLTKEEALSQAEVERRVGRRAWRPMQSAAPGAESYHP